MTSTRNVLLILLIVLQIYCHDFYICYLPPHPHWLIHHSVNHYTSLWKLNNSNIYTNPATKGFAHIFKSVAMFYVLNLISICFCMVVFILTVQFIGFIFSNLRCVWVCVRVFWCTSVDCGITWTFLAVADRLRQIQTSPNTRYVNPVVETPDFLLNRVEFDLAFLSSMGELYPSSAKPVILFSKCVYLHGHQGCC